MRYIISGLLVALSVFSYALIPARTFAANVYCECSAYLQEIKGVNIHGNADTILPNTERNDPRPGDVVVFRYPSVSHVALIEEIVGETISGLEIRIAESNFHYCKPDTRIISLNDSAVIGLYRPEVSTPQ